MTMAATTIRVKLRHKLVRIHTSRRHGKTVSYLREHIARHFHSTPEAVRISRALNEHLEANSTNRYRPVDVSINKIGAIIEASLPGEAKKADAKGAKDAVQAKPAEVGPEERAAMEAKARSPTSIQKQAAGAAGSTAASMASATKPAAEKKTAEGKPAKPGAAQAEPPK